MTHRFTEHDSWAGEDEVGVRAPNSRSEPVVGQISIVVIDDQELFREGLAHLLETEHDLRVVARTAGGQMAVAVVRQQQPDVVLLGSDSPSVEVAKHMQHLLEAAPPSRIVILASHDDPRRVRHLLSYGAHAYMVKSATTEELLTIIRVVDRHHDRVVLSVSRETANRLRGSQDLTLSDRELEVLTLVGEGMRNSQVAATLFIAEGTVKRHLTNIYSKLGATSRTDAVRKANRQGLGL